MGGRLEQDVGGKTTAFVGLQLPTS